MAKYKIAHLREQGQNMIVVPLDDAFGQLSSDAQQETIAALQACSISAGLAGTVVPIWRSGSKMAFIAPRQWQAFFRSPGIYARLIASINKELTCG